MSLRKRPLQFEHLESRQVRAAMPLADLNPAVHRGSEPKDFESVGDDVYFLVRLEKDRLYRTDGTPEGTVAVSPPDMEVLEYRVVDGRVFYIGKATPSAPARVYDATDTNSRISSQYVSVSDGLFLQPWGDSLMISTQRTAAMIFLLHPDGTSDFIIGGENLNLEQWFVKDGIGYAFNNGLLWRTDGTLAGTYDVSKGFSASKAKVVGDKIFLYGDKTLALSDGTKKGTTVLTTQCHNCMEFRSDLVVADGGVYWEAFTRDAGQQLWFSDGTPEGTRITETRPLPKCYVQTSNFCIDRTETMVESIGDAVIVYVRSRDSPAIQQDPDELWVYRQGTPQRLEVPRQIRGRIMETPTGDGVLFQLASAEYEPETSLWRTDGTVEGTFEVLDRVWSVWEADGIRYVIRRNTDFSRSLWQTDGSPNGTFSVAEPLFHLAPRISKGTAFNQPIGRLGNQFIVGSAVKDRTDTEPFAIEAIPRHNREDPIDVNGDSHHSAIDAILIIREIAERNFTLSKTGSWRPSSVPDAYFDVSGDTRVSPLDALLVIRDINQLAVAEPVVAETLPPTDPVLDFASVAAAIATFELPQSDTE